MDKLRQLYASAVEVQLATAEELAYNDHRVCRMGPLIITSVQLEDIGLKGRTDRTHVPEEEHYEVEDVTEALQSMGLPAAFGKKDKKHEARSKKQRGPAHVEWYSDNTGTQSPEGPSLEDLSKMTWQQLELLYGVGSADRILASVKQANSHADDGASTAGSTGSRAGSHSSSHPRGKKAGKGGRMSRASAAAASSVISQESPSMDIAANEVAPAAAASAAAAAAAAALADAPVQEPATLAVASAAAAAAASAAAAAANAAVAAVKAIGSSQSTSTIHAVLSTDQLARSSPSASAISVTTVPSPPPVPIPPPPAPPPPVLEPPGPETLPPHQPAPGPQQTGASPYPWHAPDGMMHPAHAYHMHMLPPHGPPMPPPPPLHPALAALPAPAMQWQELLAGPQGGCYYFNLVTKESQWHPPACGFVPLYLKAEADAARGIAAAFAAHASPMMHPSYGQGNHSQTNLQSSIDARTTSQALGNQPMTDANAVQKTPVKAMTLEEVERELAATAASPVNGQPPVAVNNDAHLPPGFHPQGMPHPHPQPHPYPPHAVSPPPGWPHPHLQHPGHPIGYSNGAGHTPPGFPPYHPHTPPHHHWPGQAPSVQFDAPTGTRTPPPGFGVMDAQQLTPRQQGLRGQPPPGFSSPASKAPPPGFPAIQHGYSPAAGIPTNADNAVAAPQLEVNADTVVSDASGIVAAAVEPVELNSIKNASMDPAIALEEDAILLEPGAKVLLDPETAAYVRKLLPRNVGKYWLQRYSLFSRYDDGVQMDTEGWWSVTPEVLAKHQSRQCKVYSKGHVAVDAMAGCGGNAIAMTNDFACVYAVEISAKRAAMCAHNAQLYAAHPKMEVVCTDFFALAPRLVADVIFVSPPWGGPKYKWCETFPVLEPVGDVSFNIQHLLSACLEVVSRSNNPSLPTPQAPQQLSFIPGKFDIATIEASFNQPTSPCLLYNNGSTAARQHAGGQGRKGHQVNGVVALFLPRNTDLRELASLVPPGHVWQVERNYVNKRLKGITFYCFAA